VAGAEDRELYQELRLALVFNGGVSLAVWMGGVAKEIDRFRCAFHSDRPELEPYGELLDAARTEVVTDIIAGTSAGGINGALLGYVVGNGKSLECADDKPARKEAIRDTWGRLGALDDLLEQDEPRAALDSDKLFRGCAEVFAKLRDAPSDLGDEASTRIRLIVTATDSYGYPVDIDEAAVRGRDHRLEMRFRHVERPARPGLSEDLVTAVRKVVGAGSPDAWPFPNEESPRDLDGPAAPALLARAARTTSSFPVAFAPSTLPRTGSTDRLPDDPTGLTRTPPMADVLEWRGRRDALGRSPLRYAIDGGLWDNSPFAAVVRGIDRTPSDRDVARVVAYVVATDEMPSDADNVKEPDLLASVVDAIALPSNVSFVNDIERIARDLDRQKVREEGIAGLLVTGEPDAFVLAAQLFGLYKQRRCDEGGTVPKLDALPAPGASLADWRATADDWQWASRPVRAAIQEGRRLLRLVLGAVAAAREPDRAAIREMIGARGTLSLLVRVLDDLATCLNDDEESPDGAPVYGQVMHDFSATVAKLHGTLAGLEPKTRALAAAIGLTAGGADAVVKRALAMEVVLHSLTPDRREHKVDYRLRTIRPDHRWPFGSVFEGHPRPELAGAKVHHFGGFLRESWRLHDWMWGRLDGSRRMVDLLVGPRQLARAVSGGDPDALRRLAERLAEVAAPARPRPSRTRRTRRSSSSRCAPTCAGGCTARSSPTSFPPSSRRTPARAARG
jgi:hypothetical protein